MLFRSDGFSLCKRLRDAKDPTPLVLLTSRDDEIDEALGLELGADDYVAKPFSTRVLLARVASLLRRNARRDAPDVHCIPVGNAGNITAYWKGYVEYAGMGRATKRPRMLGWQAAGSAPLVLGHPIPDPETIATAIRIGDPASWDGEIGRAHV